MYFSVGEMEKWLSFHFAFDGMFAHCTFHFHKDNIFTNVQIIPHNSPIVMYIVPAVVQGIEKISQLKTNKLNDFLEKISDSWCSLYPLGATLMFIF